MSALPYPPYLLHQNSAGDNNVEQPDKKDNIKQFLFHVELGRKIA